MKLESGKEACDICGRQTELTGLLDADGKKTKKEHWAKFILGPWPAMGPQMGKMFPGIGSVKHTTNGNFTVLTLLHACPGCEKKTIDFVKTGNLSLLPDSPLKKGLMIIALTFPRWKEGLKEQLQSTRMPETEQKKFGMVKPDLLLGARPTVH